MQIGVIGSGIAGLVVSRKLVAAGHEVTLFEKQGQVGIDSASMDIPGGVSSFRADVPSRMFNSHQWPGLWRLYEELGVSPRAVNASQSFGRLFGETRLKLSKANRPGLIGLAGLVSSTNRELLKEASRLQKTGSDDLRSGLDSAMTFREYLTRGEYSDDFICYFLYPTLSSTVFTCSYESLDQYPAECVLATLNNLTSAGTGLFRASGGTAGVAARLTDCRFELKLNCGIESLRVDGQRIVTEHSDGSRGGFDHAVVATQANHALRILHDATLKEREALEAFRYESIPVFVHTDERFMPPVKKDWSTFNMLTDETAQAAMCTVWLNQFHDDWAMDKPVFQSINSFAEPDLDKVLTQVVMQRPVVNARSLVGLRTLEEIHNEPQRRIWFCGSYANRGTPLLESGVQSANTIAHLICEKSKSD